MKSSTGISDSLYAFFISLMKFISVMESVVFRLIYVFPNVSSLDEKPLGKRLF